MKQLKKDGMNVMNKTSIQKAKQLRNGKIEVTTSNGDTITSDHVIVAAGIEPECELASSANLELDPVNGGFVVNSELEARRNIWVAGDAASFYDGQLGRRRVEHHDNAIVTGRLAGGNMVGL